MKNSRMSMFFASQLALLLVVSSSAWAGGGERVLYTFTGGQDGSIPVGILAQDSAGNYYGVAQAGGIDQSGVVFELSKVDGRWGQKALYTFTGGSDGAQPVGGVIFDPKGNLYGVANSGGLPGCIDGCGTVFELSPGGDGTWRFYLLHSFTNNSVGGASPTGILALDPAGNLYGNTQGGGDSSCNCGTVFELTPQRNGKWKETVLHAFRGGKHDGSLPFESGLTRDSAGSLYGVTTLGGTNDIGTVFRISLKRDGKWQGTLLHSFVGGSDGFQPLATPALDPEGNLYGTAYRGGNDCSCGAVFELTPTPAGEWTESIIFKFSGPDGIGTFATPIFDKAGNLYGTTFDGGSGICASCGTAFELTPVGNGQWQETFVHHFQGASDGAAPRGGLIMNSAGKFVGTTLGGGQNGDGVVYEITP